MIRAATTREVSMPDYSAMTYQQKSSALAALGSRIGAFNQGSFRTDVGVRNRQFQSSIGGSSMAGGYCAGVCLDWIRRVLLSGANAQQGRLTYHYDSLIAGGAAGSKSTAVGKDHSFATVGRMGQAWHRSGQTSWTRPGDSAADAPYTLPDANWKTTARALDTSFDSSRTADRRDPSSKHFADLSVIASRMADYSNSGQWLNAVIDAIPAGNAAKFGSSRSATATGHAVAIWRRRQNLEQNDSFYLFDPNYGVFAYSADGLRSALRIMFARTGGDAPIYESCGPAAGSTGQNVEYTVFDPANRADNWLAPAPNVAAPVITAQQVIELPAITLAPPPTRPAGAVRPASPARPPAAMTPAASTADPRTAGAAAYGRPPTSVAPPPGVLTGGGGQHRWVAGPTTDSASNDFIARMNARRGPTN
jgi:hypothetical protein